MTNIVNAFAGTDTVFYNHYTPLVPGEALNLNSLATSPVLDFMATKLGPMNTNWALQFGVLYYRLPAPGFEIKTADVTAVNSASGRVYLQLGSENIDTRFNVNMDVPGTFTSVNVPGTTHSFANPARWFLTVNDYSMVVCKLALTTNTPLAFSYIGWLREPAILGTIPNRIRGHVIYNSANGNTPAGARPVIQNNASQISLSTDTSVINLPITCGGDATDVLIRDSASPNFYIGKLSNCVSLPGEAQIGTIWKNNGPDPDGYPVTNNTNKYLVACNLGTRKLGMRIWTEDFI